VLTSYRRVFAHRGAATFSATGLVARLPISMMTLGIVLLVSTLSGSYATAGQVSAAYIIGNAVVAIPHGRLADRFGQGRVLYVDAVVFALATGMLVQATTQHWPFPWPHLFAALAGAAIPQVGSLVRARWAHLLGSERDLHTAFAVEGIADEMVFVTGPPLVTFLSTIYAPQAGLLVALVAGTLGTVALAAQHRTEPPVNVAAADETVPPLPWLALLPITLSAASLGCLFGALEVATVAFAGDAGHKSVSGLLLAILSFGSMLAGVLAGAHQWRTPTLTRFRLGMVALAASMFVLPFIGSIWVLGPMLFVAGFTLAPTLIAMFSLLEASSPRSRLTESMGFVQSGLSAGIAPGAYFAGVVADHSGGSQAYWVCAASGGVAALFVWVTVARPTIARLTD
jgi:MFS family permease